MRERDHFIGIWLDDKEFANLTQLCKTSGLSASAVLRQALAGVQLRPRPPGEYTRLLRELSAIGNNINQIAKRLHETGRTYEADIADIKANQERLIELSNTIISKLAAIK